MRLASHGGERGRVQGAYIGLDVGTGGVRGLLVDATGRVRATHHQSHATLFPQPLWAEQVPEEWLRGALTVLGQLARDAAAGPLTVRAIGLTGQMHGAVVLGPDDRPLRPAIIWMDQRSAVEAEALEPQLRASGLYALTLNPSLPNMTASKIAWLKRHEPRVHARITRLLLPKDFVRLGLTGEYATDVSDASGTLMLDVPRRKWAYPIADLLGLERSALPSLHESSSISGQLRPAVAEALGLQPGIPVAAGASDQAAGGVGADVRQAGGLMLSLGTSGVLFGALNAVPVRPGHPALHLFCHAVPDAWHWMGVTQAAGGSLKWFHDNLAPGTEYADLDKEAEAVNAGAEGLMFLPYLMGERAPLLDPGARGAFVGLSVGHGRGHLARAVMEGVAHSLRQVMDVASRELSLVGPVRATGGGARSDLWRRILAATLNRPVARLTSPEGPAFGAAILAAEATGAAEPAHTWVRWVEDPEPPGGWVERYAGDQQTFEGLYPALRGALPGS